MTQTRALSVRAPTHARIDPSTSRAPNRSTNAGRKGNMTMRKFLGTRSLAAIAILATAAVVPTIGASARTNALSEARAGTARYHRIDAALAAGYGLFTDQAGIACIDNPGV